MLWPPTEIFPAPVSAPEPALYAMMAGRVVAGRGRRAQRRLALRRSLLRA